MALVVQCHVRAHFARKRANELRGLRDERDRHIIEKEEEYRRMEELKHKAEIERRTHPKSFMDFSILYKELRAWSEKET